MRAGRGEAVADHRPDLAGAIGGRWQAGRRRSDAALAQQQPAISRPALGRKRRDPRLACFGRHQGGGAVRRAQPVHHESRHWQLRHPRHPGQLMGRSNTRRFAGAASGGEFGRQARQACRRRNGDQGRRRGKRHRCGRRGADHRGDRRGDRGHRPGLALRNRWQHPGHGFGHRSGQARQGNLLPQRGPQANPAEQHGTQRNQRLAAAGAQPVHAAASCNGLAAGWARCSVLSQVTGAPPRLRA